MTMSRKRLIAVLFALGTNRNGVWGKRRRCGEPADSGGSETTSETSSDGDTGGGDRTGEVIKIGYVNNEGVGAFAPRVPDRRGEVAIEAINAAGGINGAQIEVVTCLSDASPEGRNQLRQRTDRRRCRARLHGHRACQRGGHRLVDRCRYSLHLVELVGATPRRTAPAPTCCTPRRVRMPSGRPRPSGTSASTTSPSSSKTIRQAATSWPTSSRPFSPTPGSPSPRSALTQRRLTGPRPSQPHRRQTSTVSGVS